VETKLKKASEGDSMMTTLRRLLLRRGITLTAVLWWSAASVLVAAQLPAAKPSEVGLSAERLDRLSRYLQSVVDQDRAAGVVALVARKGRVPYVKAFGKLDRETGASMTVDSIFRVASQTKAVTSVAVMIL
jgi:CubicO group peptidase (beta-lactamase class C family)